MIKLTEKFHLGWVIVVGGFLCSVSFGISRHLYPYVVPTMEANLNLPHEAMGNIASVYFIAYASTTFVWGILTDRIGPRKCILSGMVLIVIGLYGMGLTSSVVVGSLFYFLCGAGGAAQFVPLASLMSRWFGGTRRGTVLGIAMSGLGAITLLLGFVVPMILTSYSWQWSWWLAAAFVLVLAIICWFIIEDSPAKKSLDDIGTSKEEFSTPRQHITDDPHRTKLGTSVRQLLKRGTVWNLAGLYFTRGIAYVAFTTFAVTYLAETGWEADAAARVFAMWGALAMFGQPAWGIIADHLTKKYAFAIALALEAIGLFVFLGGNPTGAYIAAAIIGFADVGIPTIMAASMADYYEPRIIGTAFGFITLTFSIGAIIGPTLGGVLADRTGTLGTTILLSLGAIILSFILSLVLKKPTKKGGLFTGHLS